MATIKFCGKYLLMTDGPRFAVANKDESGTIKGCLDVVREIEEPNNDKDDHENGETETKAKNKIVRVAVGADVSPDGDRVVVTDSWKVLSLWKVSGNSFALEKTWKLSSRAELVSFQKDSKNILIADKSGDVVRFNIDKNEPEILLGHLSMLLDFQLDDKEQHVITADRDEKIRVSRFPNSYNINNFCLGHEEFVSSVTIVDNGPILVSGSGDGTIRSWRYKEGLELDARDCHKDANIKLDPSKYDKEKEGDDREPLLRRTTVPGVAKIRSFKRNLAITIESFKGVLFYKCDEKGRLSFEKKVELSNFVVDFTFNNNGSVYALLNSREKALISLGEDAKLPDFFGDLSQCETNEHLDVLYKRWYNNVESYHENKEARIKGKTLTNPPAKKAKL